MKETNNKNGGKTPVVPPKKILSEYVSGDPGLPIEVPTLNTPQQNSEELMNKIKQVVTNFFGTKLDKEEDLQYKARIGQIILALKKRDLSRYDNNAVIMEVIQAVVSGIKVDGIQSDFIPFGNSLKYHVMIAGLRMLLKDIAKTQMMLDPERRKVEIYADVVCEGDTYEKHPFTARDGKKGYSLLHVTKRIENPHADVIGAYCIERVEGNSDRLCERSAKDINRIRDTSSSYRAAMKQKKNNPNDFVTNSWMDNYWSMCIKTLIRIFMKEYYSDKLIAPEFEDFNEGYIPSFSIEDVERMETMRDLVEFGSKTMPFLSPEQRPLLLEAMTKRSKELGAVHGA